MMVTQGTTILMIHEVDNYDLTQKCDHACNCTKYGNFLVGHVRFAQQAIIGCF